MAVTQPSADGINLSMTSLNNKLAVQRRQKKMLEKQNQQARQQQSVLAAQLPTSKAQNISAAAATQKNQKQARKPPATSQVDLKLQELNKMDFTLPTNRKTTPSMGSNMSIIGAKKIKDNGAQPTNGSPTSQNPTS